MRDLTSDRVPRGAAHPTPSSADHPKADADKEPILAIGAASCATLDGEQGAAAPEGPQATEASAPGAAAPGPDLLRVNLATDDADDADDTSHQDTIAAAEAPSTGNTASAVCASYAGARLAAQSLGDATAPGSLL